MRRRKSCIACYMVSVCGVLKQPNSRGKILLNLTNLYLWGGFSWCVKVNLLYCLGSLYLCSAIEVVGAPVLLAFVLGVLWKNLILQTKRCWRRRQVVFTEFAFCPPLFSLNLLHASRFCHRWSFPIVFLVVAWHNNFWGGFFFQLLRQFLARQIFVNWSAFIPVSWSCTLCRHLSASLLYRSRWSDIILASFSLTIC